MRDAIERAWQYLQEKYQTLAMVEWKQLSLLLVLFILFYYAVTGIGQTVIADFKSSQDLQKELNGLNESVLISHLLTEVQGIRAVQDRAKVLQFDLVENLASFRLASADFNVQLSTQVNTDYKQLVQNIRTFELGPVQVPVSLVLRPLQWMIGQTTLQISLHRLGVRYYLTAHSDSGGAWVVTDEDLTVFEAPGDTGADKLVRLLTALAYKLAFEGAKQYQPAEVWQGVYKAHQGLRSLIQYDRLRGVANEQAKELLGKAISAFEGAITLNPEDSKAYHNLILTLIEQASSSPPRQAIAQYETIADRLRQLARRPSSHPILRRPLWIATYALLGETQRQEAQFSEAIVSYRKALAFSEARPELRAVLLNNMGLAYNGLQAPDEAAKVFRQAIALRPDYVQARVNLGKFFFVRLHDHMASEKELREALRLRPEAFRASNNLGILYLDALEKGLSSHALDDSATSCMLEQGILLAAQAVERLTSKEDRQDLDHNEQQDLDTAKILQIEFMQKGAQLPTASMQVPRRSCFAATK